MRSLRERFEELRELGDSHVAYTRKRARTKLHLIEEQAASGVLEWRGAQAELEDHPLTHEEMRSVVFSTLNSVSRMLKTTCRVEYFSPTREKDSGLDGTVIFYNYDVKGQTLYTPSEGKLHLPLAIAHQVATRMQIRDFEPRSMFQKRYHAYMFDDALPRDERHRLMHEFEEERAAAVLEGWPLFVAQLYAQKRDAKVGAALYTPLAAELANSCSAEARWGAQLYEIIYNEGKMGAAIDAALSAEDNRVLMNMATIANNRKFGKAVQIPDFRGDN